MIDIMTDWRNVTCSGWPGSMALWTGARRSNRNTCSLLSAVWDHHEETLRELFGHQTGDKNQALRLAVANSRRSARGRMPKMEWEGWQTAPRCPDAATTYRHVLVHFLSRLVPAARLNHGVGVQFRPWAPRKPLQHRYLEATGGWALARLHDVGRTGASRGGRGQKGLVSRGQGTTGTEAGGRTAGDRKWPAVLFGGSGGGRG
jgi:hypothetical protein